mmetsp:Transcript_27071/g.63245  ORF Transcript_27071/g.63245 Transcript_27071/m.63245 type:complete len:84 (-) Transcript_27071:264-515(-)
MTARRARGGGVTAEGIPVSELHQEALNYFCATPPVAERAIHGAGAAASEQASLERVLRQPLRFRHILWFFLSIIMLCAAGHDS